MRRALRLALSALLAASPLANATPARAQDPFRSDFDTLPGVPEPERQVIPRTRDVRAEPVRFLRDPPAPAFGERGELVLSGALIGGLSRTTYVGSDAERFSVSLSPGLDVFVAHRVSVGLALSVLYADDRGYGTDGSLVRVKRSSLSIGPRLGYVFTLGDTLSLWPTVTFGVSTSKQDASLESGRSLSTGNAVGSPSARWTGAWVGAYAPLIFHVKPHLFLGFGPTFSHDFAKAIAENAVSSAGAQATSFGAALTVGGFWGGSEVADGPPAPIEAGTRRRRFGDAGQIVLSNETTASFSSVRYAGTDAGYDAFGVTPAVDAFVADRVSVGGRARVSVSSLTGMQPNGTPFTISRSAWALGPSAGFEAPLGPSVSVWMRVGIELGSSTSSSHAQGSRTVEHSVATLSA